MPSPRYWREVPARLRLEAGRCTACGKVSYPARRVCPSCRGEAVEPIGLSPRGKVVTSTVIHTPPPEFQMEAPYAMAIVETPERVRLMVQVADCAPGEVEPGAEVAMFQAYQGEARRQGVEVERLVQQTVNCLVRELEEEEREGVGDCSPS
jgi:hypothetical protein